MLGRTEAKEIHCQRPWNGIRLEAYTTLLGQVWSIVDVHRGVEYLQYLDR
jgi:hypothetical protein